MCPTTRPDGRAGEYRDAMSEAEFEAKLSELDRLLNDPDVRMDPHRVWSLLAEISRPPTPQRPAPIRPH